MAILNPIFKPTDGQPGVVVLPRKRKKLTDEDFYAARQGATNPVDASIFGMEGQPGQQEQQPLTGDYFAQQLEKYANRAQPPKLEPGARVNAVDSSNANPANFQGYYDMLGSITDMGNQQTAAAAARSAAIRARAAAELANQQVQTPGIAAGSGGSYKGGSIFGSPTGGGGQMGSVPSNPRANFAFAQAIAPNYGWSDPGQMGAWYTLGMKESGWNNNAQNPTSTAYGIGQFLNSTWGGYGIAKTSDPKLQVEAMARYIKARYGTPAKALAFHLSHNWY